MIRSLPRTQLVFNSCSTYAASSAFTTIERKTNLCCQAEQDASKIVQKGALQSHLPALFIAKLTTIHSPRM